MDSIKLILFLSSLLFCASSHSAVFDMGEHSGVIRDSNGNFSQVSSNGSVRTLTNNSTLSLAEKVSFQTAKGVFSTDIVRTAVVDTARMGATVRGLGVLGGPLGLTITAVSLVCELTTICNQAGQWMTTEVQTIPPGTNGGWTCSHSTGQQGTIDFCKANYYGCNNPARLCSEDAIIDGGLGYKFKISERASGFVNGYADLHRPTAWIPAPTGNTAPTTTADWNAKESLLNDNRFTPELFTKGQAIPVQTPNLPTPVSIPIGKETKTTKDGSGNVTGTEEATTTAKLEQPTSGENPTNNPNLLKVSETTINNTYNVNNQLTGSTTTTTAAGSEQQPQTQPQSVEIEIDNMQDAPLQEKEIAMPFDTDSWGSGSCPAARSVSYHFGQLELSFQPVCDFAEGIRPIVLILAGFAALYILMGAGKND